MNNITIKTVAARAGVSIATVSRVINGLDKVTAKTTQRVLDVIKQVDYIPNQAARSLKISQTYSIGFIVSDIRNEYMTMISSTIDMILRKNGYFLFVCNCYNDAQSEQDYLRVLLEKQIDGIIINTTGFNNDYIAEISLKVPIVALHRKIEAGTFRGDWIDTDIFSSAYDITRILISKGHRKIGVINGPSYLSTAIGRYKGFEKAIAEIGQNIGPGHPYFYEGLFTKDTGLEAAQYFWNLKDRPTAIVCMHGETLLGAMRFFHNNGIAIPEEISLVTVSIVADPDLLFINPYACVMEYSTIGIRVAEMILERILSNNSLPNRKEFFPMPISEGESVKDLNVRC